MKFSNVFNDKIICERLSFNSIAIASVTLFKSKRLDIVLDIYETTVKRYIQAYFNNDIRNVMDDTIFRVTFKSGNSENNPYEIKLANLPARMLQQIDHILSKDLELAKNIETKYAQTKIKTVIDQIFNYIDSNPKDILQIVC